MDEQQPLTLEAAASSSSSAATTAAVNRGRRKVPLGPGYSAIDWARLVNSGQDQANLAPDDKAKFRKEGVSKEELAKHHTLEDCWVSLHGHVFNMTAYLNYHPGGKPELMRAAGGDATPLFMETHAWVNVGYLLKNCHVGELRKTD